jgi:hypothetical protein
MDASTAFLIGFGVGAVCFALGWLVSTVLHEG